MFTQPQWASSSTTTRNETLQYKWLTLARGLWASEILERFTSRAHQIWKGCPHILAMTCQEISVKSHLTVDGLNLYNALLTAKSASISNCTKVMISDASQLWSDDWRFFFNIFQSYRQSEASHKYRDNFIKVSITLPRFAWLRRRPTQSGNKYRTWDTVHKTFSSFKLLQSR